MTNKDTLKERENLLKNNAGRITCQCGNPICLDMVNKYWFNLLEQERKEEREKVQTILLKNVITIQDYGQFFKREVFDEITQALSQNTTQEEVTNGK